MVGVGIMPQFNIKIRKKIRDGVSKFAREMIVILTAVQWVEEVRPLQSIICSD